MEKQKCISVGLNRAAGESEAAQEQREQQSVWLLPLFSGPDGIVLTKPRFHP